MTIIEAQVKDQELKVTTEPLVASGGINETTIHFSFCENWTNFVKTAVFADAGKENWYNVVLDANKAVVPAQVTATKGRFWFGVVGIKDQTRYTTKIIQYDVAEGVTLAEEDVEPPQSTIDQILAALGNVSAEASAVRVEMQIHPTGAPVKDDTVAYIKNVPAASLPAAKINKIGGMTRKGGNLLPYPYAETTKTTSGVTFTDNSDGTITVNDTAAGQLTFFFATNEKISLPAGTYTFSVDYVIPSNVTVWLYKTSESRAIAYLTAGEQQKTFTLAKEESFNVYLHVGAGAIFSNAVLKPMLNSGATALPYEPYFEGLRSAPVTEVESVGANLATAQEVYEGANRYLETTLDGRKVIRFCANILTNNKVLKFKENTQYTVGGWFKNEKTSESNATANAYITFFYTDGTSNSGTIAQNADWGYYTFTSTNGKTVEGVGLSVYNFTSDVYVDIDTFMFNEGATALPYTPYTKNTLPIPEEVRPKNGINENVYDFIEWCVNGTRKNYECVGCVDMGTLIWIKHPTYENCFYTGGITGRKIGYEPLLAVGYENKFSFTENRSIFGNTVVGNTIYVVDDRYTDATAFKTAMSGVMLYYELAEPIITDISDKLPADNFIAVEGGGTLTFKNEFGFAVPSEVINYLNAATGVIVDGSPALKVGDTIITEAQLAALLGLI